jgi:hypothetical protein
LLFVAVFALILFSTGKASCQQVSLTNSTAPVETGTSESFSATVTGLPSGYTVYSYTWTASFLGPTGPSGIAGSINGIIDPVFGVTVTIAQNDPSPNMNTAAIIWGDFFSSVSNSVTVKVIAKAPNKTDLMIENTLSVDVRRILAGVLSGSSSIQRCCLTPVTYSMIGHEDGLGGGYDYAWTFPSSWSLANGSNTTSSSITLIPDANLGGTLSCVVRRPAAHPSYSRTFTRSVGRYNPAVSFTASSLEQNLVCPGQTFTYTVTPPACGVNNIAFSEPPGWTRVSVSGNSIQLMATWGSESGNLTANVTMNGGCFVSPASLALTVLTGVPPAPQFVTFNGPIGDPGWHDGRWHVCAGGNSTLFEVYEIFTAQSYTFQVSSPWKVNGQSGAVTVDIPFVLVSGPSNAPPTGILSARANNCQGPSPWTSLTFYREDERDCDGKGGRDFTSPYGSVNTMESGGTIERQGGQKHLEVFSVNPNPVIHELSMQWNNSELKNVFVWQVNGSLTGQWQTESDLLVLNTEAWAPGWYFLRATTTSGKMQTTKILKQ